MAFFDTSISSVNESITSWMTLHVQYGPLTMGPPHAYFIYLYGFIDEAPYTAESPLNQSVSTLLYWSWAM